MRIISNRADDLRKAKSDYIERKNERDRLSEEGYKRFKDETQKVFDIVLNEVESTIKPIRPSVNVDVRSGLWNSIEVSISDEDDKFNEDKALAWSYRINMDNEGNINKESSSWSGLNATTETNLADLKNIVECLEAIQNIDWASVLGKELPKYDEYVPKFDDDPDSKRNFDREIKEAEIEDLIGSNTLVKTSGLDRNWRGQTYVGILKDSGSQYTVFEIPSRYIDNAIENNEIDNYRSDAFRVKKDKLLNSIIYPLDVIEY